MTLSLIEALTPALIEHVHGRDLDVAVVTDGPDGAGLPASVDCTHLLDDHLMVAVGRGHRFARRRAVFLREVIARHVRHRLGHRRERTPARAPPR